MTRMIRQVLADNNASDWYKSFCSTEGCVSLLQYLKNIAQQAFADEVTEKIDFNNAKPISNLSL